MSRKLLTVAMLSLILFSIIPYSSLVSSNGQQKQQASWTFMVYMCADNDLEDAAFDDINEMELVGSTDDVNIIVLVDFYGSDNTYLMEIVQDTNLGVINSPTIWSGELDMGDPSNLRSFFEWTVGNYPARYYALIIWDHGAGWRTEVPIKGVCFDYTSGSYIDMLELSSALGSVYSDTGVRPHVLGFDACLMGMLEVAYEIRVILGEYGGVMVSSEEVVPGDGYPYDTILGWLVGNPLATPFGLGSTIVDYYNAYYASLTPPISWVTMSAVRLDLVDEVVGNVDLLAEAMMGSDYDEVMQARLTTEHYYYSYYIDLRHFAERIYDETSSGDVQTTAAGVIDALNDAVFREGHGSDHPNSHGLSIYFPTSESEWFGDYSYLNFAYATHWDEFLHWYLEGGPTPLPYRLYAGGHNPGVVYAYVGGTDWNIISPTLGYAVMDLIEYNGHLYAAVTTGSGGYSGVGRVYRYDGGTSWTLVGEFTDYAVISLAVYQGELYAGTGCGGFRLYKYTPGTTNVGISDWTLVVDYTPWQGVRALYVSHGYLLMGDSIYDRIGLWDGSNFYAVVDDGGWCIYDFQDYGGYVFAAAYNGRIWVSSDAVSWSVALDYYDGNMWELEVFQDRLYMAYNDGELRAWDGTGDLRGVLVYTAPDGILSMATDGDYLYFGTGGDAVGYGAEYTGDATVYRYDGSNVVPISDPDEMGEGVQVLYVSTRPPPQPAPTPPPTPPPSEWTEIVSDPIEGVGVDIVGIDSQLLNNDLYVRVRTNNIINPENFMGITFLDVDQDPLTGIPILLADVPITGVEYLVIVPPQELPEGQNWGYGAIAYITPYGELQLVAIIVIHFGETSYWYSIPLALLWDEGYMNVIQLTLSTEVPAGRSSLDAVKATFDTWPSLDAVEAFFRSPCTPFLADIAPDIPMGTTQLTEEWTEIIDDPEEGPIPDIVGVYSMLETDGNKIALSVKFSTLFYGTARIYLDTDQNRATGFHLLGAEYMVKTDPESANLYAWVEESEEFELVDSYSISYEGGDSCAFAIPLVDLADDGIMNVFVVAYGEVGSTDTAPNLAFGSTSPLISWEEMVTDPDDNVVPDVVAIDCSLTENMLSFRIRFDGPYYYPENGFVGITALDTDRNPNTGVRVGDIGADYAVVMVVGRSERIKAYDQWLPKTKIPIRSGRAMLNRWSSTTQSWQPVAELPALIGLGRYTIGIPLLLLGDDGILTFIQYVGDATMITDVVPDVGHASSTPVIDVAITNLIVEPPTPTIGETAEIVATVENQGIRSIVAVIDFAVDATTIGSVAIPLGARESAPVQVAWTPPSIGTYSITATARPLPGEEDLTDNSLTITLTLVADLAVTNIWIEPEPVLGFTSIIYVEVENQGNSIEYATVTFYDGTATALGEEIGSVTSETPLQPGETAELSIEWVPEIMGDRVIRAVLEPVLGETDVADNTFATTVTVLGVHDVAVTELTVTPTNPIVNRYCTIRVGIQNQGSYSESNVVVTVTVLSETTQVFTWSTTVRTLASGASRTLTTRWRPTATGRYMIRASITPVPDEIDTTDNVMERPVTVVPRGIKIDLNATPERVSIRSLTPVVITIQLKDKNGNILRLQGVVIELKTSRGTLSTTSVITDENGCATVLLTPDGRRGTVIVTASIRGIATSRIRIRFY